MWGRLTMAEMESSQNKELRLIWEQPWASPARKHGPHPTAAGTGFCQQLSEPKGRFFPGGSRGVLSPAQPRLQSRETPSRGPPRAYMTSVPQNHEIIKKNVCWWELLGGGNLLHIQRKIFKNWIGGPPKRIRISFLHVCEVILPYLGKKVNNDLFNFQSWPLWQTLMRSI